MRRTATGLVIYGWVFVLRFFAWLAAARVVRAMSATACINVIVSGGRLAFYATAISRAPKPARVFAAYRRIEIAYPHLQELIQ